jgi:hypothetical protein
LGQENPSLRFSPFVIIQTNYPPASTSLLNPISITCQLCRPLYNYRDGGINRPVLGSLRSRVNFRDGLVQQGRLGPAPIHRSRTILPPEHRQPHPTPRRPVTLAQGRDGLVGCEEIEARRHICSCVGPCTIIETGHPHHSSILFPSLVHFTTSLKFLALTKPSRKFTRDRRLKCTSDGNRIEE